MRKDDRMLVEVVICEIDSDGGGGAFFRPIGYGDRSWAPGSAFHEPPIVPVADLIEFVDLLRRRIYAPATFEEYRERFDELEQAYLAAGKPKEVWVRALPSPDREGFYIIGVHPRGDEVCMRVDPDDIREDEPS